MARAFRLTALVLSVALGAACAGDAESAGPSTTAFSPSRSTATVATTMSTPISTPISTIAETAVSIDPAATESTMTTTTTAPATITTTTTPTPATITTTTTPTPATTTTTTTTTLPGPPMTGCTNVAHISDSTGVYLWETRYMDRVENTMGARYRSVGVENIIEDASGGRSIRERVADWQTTALEAADAIRAGGFDGCWVVMIGTNDAANIAAGANLGAEQRILRMLYVFGDDPVLWVDAVTQRSAGAYRNDSMRAWNEALYRIAAERDNLAVLRWSERALPGWFVADGIHYRTDGRIWRAAITAASLAEYFPA